jgi:hypothetical protein
MSPPMLGPPRVGKEFKLYVATLERVIGAVLTQEHDGSEFPITYLSRRLIDAKTRYIFVEKRYLCTMLAVSFVPTC